MKKTENFDFLDDEKIAEKIIDFKDKNITFVRFFIPSIYCSSCISVLENLSNHHKYILESTVDFSNKKVGIIFKNKDLRLSELAVFLEKIGYKPSINSESIEDNQEKIFDRKLIGKLAVSFFCFGNIMLLAIPEYVGAYEDVWFLENRNFFRYLMGILSFPVVLFSLMDHVKYALLGLKKHIFNMDIPITIGIVVLFLWSCYEVFLDLGSGYFDSLAGFSFFLLLSRMFQIHTHRRILSFDQNYKSFYPIYVSRICNNKEEKILLSSLKKGDLIAIRNEEIIPADSILIKGIASLDNSFITGESHLINKKIGERIYAGSKQKGEIIYLKIIKNIDQSYLSLLWNKKKFYHKKLLHLNSISNRFSQYFTPIILMISIITGIYWSFINVSKVFQTTFSVLIITCPCALVLSSPLIFGNIIRFFSKKGFYVKDIFTMERISTISTLIFDKTGTITDPNKEKVFFIGKKLRHKEKKIIASLLRNSNHPLSKKIFTELSIKEYYSINNFQEIIGQGMQGVIQNVSVKIGSPKYLGITINNWKETTVAVSINEKFFGYFLFRNFYRKGIKKIFKNLKKYEIVILSGDNNELEKKYLESILPKSSKIFFNQSPEEKFNYVKKIQRNGKQVMMIGDGINDYAALNQSEVGVAISENPSNFFPSCDAFIQSNYLDKIFLFLKISKIATRLVIVNFMISLFYNGIGIIFAVTGHLKPFIAAILMPLSSLSVIIFSILSTWMVSRRFLS
ncbi:cytochrome cbb3 oxidase maturation protein CcoI [Blattabacterium sp. (Periplaneta americana) str. BPLAN]|uniref:heavy metal translocating P-type ATPase n=1 Tax=Blattabacterium sp. (Periplaneta americana) TaxID=367488 RepID=UPI0001BA0BD2|nr:HAD-IC family P-type ATPase [Blattabacterium sp. (Periplaneta americana)]ACX83852.1 cytochrome cbb3 oxidase maturation protein CcoI [Blattabacterium sp. (Periplaneta americana) str. BPLAN]